MTLTQAGRTARSTCDPGRDGWRCQRPGGGAGWRGQLEETQLSGTGAERSRDAGGFQRTLGSVPARAPLLRPQVPAKPARSVHGSPRPAPRAAPHGEKPPVGWTHTRAHTRHTCAHMHTGRHTCTHVHTRTHTHRHACAHMHPRAHMHTHVHAHRRTHVHTRTCKHMHTHGNVHATAV